MKLPNITYRITAAGRNLAPARANWIRRRGSSSLPDVTFVTVGRNDDYAPDFAKRLAFILAWNMRAFARQAIFIEWNPPADRPLLSLDLARQFERLRCYVVTPRIHALVCDNPRLPLMEYHAKNVGIRRADTDWVLASNSDVLVGLDIRSSALQGLDSEHAYTAQRVDVHPRVNAGAAALLRNPRHYVRVHPHTALGTGDFLLAHRTMWHRAGGYDEGESRSRIGCDVRGLRQMELLGARSERLGYIFHLDHPTSCVNMVAPHHGEHAMLPEEPYRSPTNWGLRDAEEVQIAERVWEIN